jgi:hypothetical protein
MLYIPEINADSGYQNIVTGDVSHQRVREMEHWMAA